ncbi:MAG: protein kinase [Armatimonadetes bacterium]|nr:protein kinase [Armatimonadota bacterium]
MAGNPPSPKALEIGEVLLGRYELAAALSEGGMGAVYKARDLEDGGAWVALKRMRPMAGDEEIHRDLVARKFQEEVEMLRRLDCSGIPRLVDSFEHDGLPCIVMEFVAGQNLEQLLEDYRSSTGEAFPAPQAIEMAVQICGLLEHLHRHRPEPLIHRDVKPANIIRAERDSRYYLVDFGLARGAGGLSTKTLVGTVAYAPLEQFQGHPEPRSDQYSLGATLHSLVSGQPPVPFTVPSLLEVQPGVNPRLAEIVTRATARNPADRFASITEMKEALLGLQREGSRPSGSGRPVEEQPSGSREPLGDQRSGAPVGEQPWTESGPPAEGQPPVAPGRPDQGQPPVAPGRPDGRAAVEAPRRRRFWTSLPVQVFCLVCVAAGAVFLSSAWDASRRIGVAFQAFETPATARSEWRCLASYGLSEVPEGVALERPSDRLRSGAIFESTGGRPTRACRFRLRARNGQPAVLLFCGTGGVLFEDDTVANGYRARPVAITMPRRPGANPLNFVSYRAVSGGKLLPDGYAGMNFELRLERGRLALFLAPESARLRLFLEAPLAAEGPPGPHTLGFLLLFPGRHPSSVEIGQLSTP